MREVSHGDLMLSNSMGFGRPYIPKIKTCIHDGWIEISDIAMRYINVRLHGYTLLM